MQGWEICGKGSTPMRDKFKPKGSTPMRDKFKHKGSTPMRDKFKPEKIFCFDSFCISKERRKVDTYMFVYTLFLLWSPPDYNKQENKHTNTIE